jgi:hypothetical protein
MALEIRKRFTILGQSTGLITEKVLNSAKFLRQSARAYDRARDLIIFHDKMSIDCLAHIQINS